MKALLGGVVFGTQLCKTQILTRYLFSALKNFLLNRSGITEGPIPVFKSRPIWGQGMMAGWMDDVIDGRKKILFSGVFYLMRVASLHICDAMGEKGT